MSSANFQLNKIPTLRELATWDLGALSGLQQPIDNEAALAQLDALRRLLTDAVHHARTRLAEIERLASQCRDFAGIEYDFLYDASRHLMTIGYNVIERRRDSELLRSIGIGSTTGQLCCDCTGQGSTGELVLIGPAAYQVLSGANALILGRLDVLST